MILLLPVPGASHDVTFRIDPRLGFFEDHRFHHLAHHAVGQDHDRRPVLVGKIEGVHGQVRQFLRRGRDRGR